ncbi:MAG: F0F1 ATP synthase subunit A [Bdellovibrionales bacterium]
MHSPLEQFLIKSLIPLNLFGYDVAFTNATLFMLLAIVLTTLLMTVGFGTGRMVPTRMQMLAESLYSLVSNMVDSAAGRKARPFFPFIFTLFTFILIANMLGMLPGSFTVTSQIIVTFAMAAFVFLMVTVTGFLKHGIHFFHLFVPKGSPAVLLPILFVLELFSFLIRPFSLSIRLFANMLAGHILMKVFAGMMVMLIGALGTYGYVVGILPTALNIFMVGFEFFVAFLQAYIFAILSSLYLRDALEMH